MKIVVYPNEKLTSQTQEVRKVDLKTERLIKKMRETLNQVKGVGLAAPQIGKSLNLTVIGYEPTKEQLKENPDLKSVPKMVLINPKIVSHSKQTTAAKECCLSHPKLEITVPRFKKIHLEYLDENGRRKKIRAKGYLARVIQHEIDHLAGKTIADYLR